MGIYTNGEAIIRHGQSGDDFELISDDLEWTVIDSDDREMGPETHYSAQVDHPKLGKLVWHLWEYPPGAVNLRHIDTNGHRVIRDFTYGLDSGEDTELQNFDGRVEEAVDWFRSNYEDPAQRTSYNSREGGYLWDHGGPFDARDEIASEFPDLPEAILDAAVAKVEEDGITEWAGGPQQDQYDASDQDDGFYSLDEPLPGSVFGDFDEPQDEETIPEQSPGLTFILGMETGRIELGATGSASAYDPIAQLRGVALASADELIGLLSGSNAFASLVTAAKNYRAAVGAAPMSVDLVYAFGVRLENARSRLFEEIERGDAPPMGASAAAALDSVLAIHGPMLLSTKRGQELIELASAYSQPDIDSEKYRSAAQGLVAAVRDANELVSSEAADTLAAVNQDVGTGPYQERSLHVAHSGNRNILIILSSLAALSIVPAVGAGFSLSDPGVGISELVRAASNSAWRFLYSQMPVLQHFVAASGMADMGWLAALLRKVKAGAGGRSV